MQKQVFLIFCEISWYYSKQFASEGLVEGLGCDCKCDGFNHVLYKLLVIEDLKDGSKLHENSLWLNTIAKESDNLVQFLLVYIFL